MLAITYVCYICLRSLSCVAIWPHPTVVLHCDDWLLCSVVHMAPSVTPYQYLNMGYRIYTVDGNYPNSSWVSGHGCACSLLACSSLLFLSLSLQSLIDHDTYFMDLVDAKSKNATNWKHEYSAKVGLAHAISTCRAQDSDRFALLSHRRHTTWPEWALIIGQTSRTGWRRTTRCSRNTTGSFIHYHVLLSRWSKIRTVMCL